MNKKRLYEIFGAKWFQKVVLKLEKIKFKVENFLFPDNKLYKIGEKRLEKQKQRKLKKTHDENERNKILNLYKYRKMKMKRQLVNAQNDNYHLNLINVDEFKKYLEWNKKVHKTGLIKNVVLMTTMIPLTLLTSGFISTIALIILIVNVISGAINFECVNLQNYNLLRYEEKYDRLKKTEEKIISMGIRKYKDANEVVAKTLKESVDVPTPDDIIRNITTKEQKEQLLALVINEQKKRKIYVDDKIDKVYVHKKRRK